MTTANFSQLSTRDNQLFNNASTPDGIQASCRNDNYTYELRPGFSLAVDRPVDDWQGATHAQPAANPQVHIVCYFMCLGVCVRSCSQPTFMLRIPPHACSECKFLRPIPLGVSGRDS